MRRILDFIIGLIVMPIIEFLIRLVLLLLPFFASAAGEGEAATIGFAAALILNYILAAVLLVILFFVRPWMALGYLISIIVLRLLDFFVISFLF